MSRVQPGPDPDRNAGYSPGLSADVDRAFTRSRNPHRTPQDQPIPTHPMPASGNADGTQTDRKIPGRTQTRGNADRSRTRTGQRRDVSARELNENPTPTRPWTKHNADGTQTDRKIPTERRREATQTGVEPGPDRDAMCLRGNWTRMQRRQDLGLSTTQTGRRQIAKNPDRPALRSLGVGGATSARRGRRSA